MHLAWIGVSRAEINPGQIHIDALDQLRQDEPVGSVQS